jgi:hypothetical protein
MNRKRPPKPSDPFSAANSAALPHIGSLPHFGFPLKNPAISSLSFQFPPFFHPHIGELNGPALNPFNCFLNCLIPKLLNYFF